MVQYNHIPDYVCQALCTCNFSFFSRCEWFLQASVMHAFQISFLIEKVLFCSVFLFRDIRINRHLALTNVNKKAKELAVYTEQTEQVRLSKK